MVIVYRNRPSLLVKKTERLKTNKKKRKKYEKKEDTILIFVDAFLVSIFMFHHEERERESERGGRSREVLNLSLP